MCDPSLALMGIGAGASAFGAAEEAEARNQAHMFNAALLERNARIAEMDAEYAIGKGKSDRRRLEQEVDQFKGGQRASFAGSGVVVDSGSALDVVADTAALGAIDALTIERNASREAWALKEEARGARAQAGLHRGSVTDPSKAFFTSLIGGAANVGPLIIGVNLLLNGQQIQEVEGNANDKKISKTSR